MRFTISKAHAEVGEPSRATVPDAGRRTFPLATAKLRERAAAGMGELLAQQLVVERMMRTRPEDSELPRRVETPEAVTAGLGLRPPDEDRVRLLVTGASAEFDERSGTPRVFFARGQLLDALRAMPHVGTDARQELVRRACAYWSSREQTEVERAPTVRWSEPAQKALVLRALPVDLEHRVERLIKGPYLPGGDQRLDVGELAQPAQPRFVAVAGNTYLVRHALRALGGRWDATSRTWQVPFDRAGDARELVVGSARPAGPPQAEPAPAEQQSAAAAPVEPDEPAVPDGAVAEERFAREYPGRVVGALRETPDGLMRVAAASRPARDEREGGGWRWTEYLLPAMAHEVPVSKALAAAPPTFGPVAGATNPGMRAPELPDFRAIYLGPEARERQDREAEQARRRRRSMWRDFREAGLHGEPDRPVLRYVPAAARTRHYLTAEELRAHKRRVRAGTGLDEGTD